MRIVFMGTPDFSVPTLEALIAGGHDVVAVVTQPDKPKGRGGQMQFTPVKEAALKHGITVYQPAKVRAAEFVDILKEINPDVMVVIAFGQIVSREILDIPKYGCINIHASLLPEYRGAAPIQWAVIDGKKETGITAMQMDEGIDTGDMLMKKIIPLAEDETGGSLFDRIANAGGEVILETLKMAEAGMLKPEKQDESKATHVGKLDKKLGNIDFANGAVEIERLIRGLNPWPSAYTKLGGKTLKLWKASVVEDDSDADAGVVTSVSKDSFIIKTGNKSLKILELQLEGKKRMDTKTFLMGYKLDAGTKLGF